MKFQSWIQLVKTTVRGFFEGRNLIEGLRKGLQVA